MARRIKPKKVRRGLYMRLSEAQEAELDRKAAQVRRRTGKPYSRNDYARQKLFGKRARRAA